MEDLAPTHRRTRSKSVIRPPTLNALRNHISSNLNGDLSLAALARRAGMSTSCFSRWFREQTGVTPHAYVIETRVERAKKLLQESELSLLEVALAVGFSSQPCLNVTFRRHAGMTPAAFRRQISTKAKDETDTRVKESSKRRPRRSIAS